MYSNVCLCLSRTVGNFLKMDGEQIHIYSDLCAPDSTIHLLFCVAILFTDRFTAQWFAGNISHLLWKLTSAYWLEKCLSTYELDLFINFPAFTRFIISSLALLFCSIKYKPVLPFCILYVCVYKFSTLYLSTVLCMCGWAGVWTDVYLWLGIEAFTWFKTLSVNQIIDFFH